MLKLSRPSPLLAVATLAQHFAAPSGVWAATVVRVGTLPTEKP